MEHAKNPQIPMIQKGRGRPSIDWELLYQDWLKSGQHKSVFLSNLGVDPSKSRTKQMTKYWTRDGEDAVARVKAESKNRPVKQIAEMWQVVQQWRAKQASDDYKIADSIRTHLKIMLNNGITRKIVDGQEIIDSKFKPHELARLAQVAETVQRNQRLALGMSTENVGVSDPDTHVERQEEVIDCPIFEVQVSSEGKFKRARPVQVK